MKKILTLFLVLVSVAGFAAGTTKVDTGDAEYKFGNLTEFYIGHQAVLSLTNGQTIASGAYNYPLVSEYSDTQNCFDASTTYTVPVTGMCSVDLDLLLQMPSDADFGRVNVDICYNGATIKRIIVSPFYKAYTFLEHRIITREFYAIKGAAITIKWVTDGLSTAAPVVVSEGNDKYGSIRIRMKP